MEDQFELKQSNDLGRYVVARKDIPKGQVIFCEEPLIVYPATAGISASEDKFVCYCCFRIIKKRSAVLCKKCHWPACDLECSLNSEHDKLECSVLYANNIFPSVRAVKHLGLIRALVCKATDTQKWEDILNLCSETNYLKEEWRIDLKEATLDTFDFLLTHCKMKISLSLVYRLVSIFSINAFSFMADNKEDLNQGHSAIYKTSCMLSHSCCPSAVWYIPMSYYEEGKGKWAIQLVAIRDIKAGEKVTIAYTDEHLECGTPERRRLMLEKLHFFCQCDRCRDSTECELFSSALKCSSCKGGWMIPEVSTNPELFLLHGTEWKCNKCCISLSWTLGHKMESSLARKLKKIWNFSTENPKLCAEKLDEKIISARRKFGLNHNLIIWAIHRWLVLVDMDILLQSSAASKKAYQKYIQRSNRCLGVYKKIGCINNIVKIEALLSMIISRYRFKSNDYMKIAKNDYTPGQTYIYIGEIVEHIKNGILLGDRKTNDGEMKDIVQLLKERLSIWETRLAKVIVQKKRSSRTRQDI